MPTRKLAATVFLNIPYDQQFENLYLAYLVGISCFGLVPRATLEVPGGNGRLDRILDLVRDCTYSIHDLSRVQLDRARPRAPRFNMPFELGLAVACERFGENGQVWFVFETVALRLNKSLSDLSATDPYVHNGTIAGVFRELCNCFTRERRQPSVQQMWRVYRDIRRNVPDLRIRTGADSLYRAKIFKDICVLASALADLHVR